MALIKNGALHVLEVLGDAIAEKEKKAAELESFNAYLFKEIKRLEKENQRLRQKAEGKEKAKDEKTDNGQHPKSPIDFFNDF